MIPQRKIIGLADRVSIAKPPILEYRIDTRMWHLWVGYDKRLENGSYLAMHPTGALNIVTITPDGTPDYRLISQPTKVQL